MHFKKDRDMNQYSTSTRGFTLIELMIVMAILAILLATAIPAYQNFTIRASVSEALAGLAPIKTDLAEFYVRNGRFPVSGEREQFQITPADQHPTFRNLNVHGVGACNANAGCAQSRVEVQLQRRVYRGVGGDSHSQMRLEGLASPNGTITWKCGPRDVQPLKPEWLPATCRETS
ncbi:MAG: prepilin-type N-terminal cleavage/methylation domain-containing protein [Wenzhouxiangella sp.]|nr:MAG: prepilin-type N-terminal cleavage/methylation domain-containing protein [Wenzhouxiangella sp.]